jgi:hypothetical protein
MEKTKNGRKNMRKGINKMRRTIRGKEKDGVQGEDGDYEEIGDKEKEVE